MIIDELFEAPQQCPECGGISFSDLILAEKKDACYHKVKASAKVWPSAYASGRLVQCRKKGAANYGKSKTESVSEGVGNIGDQIKAVYQKIYDQGDDAVEFMYYDSPIFAQYWDEYEGDLDSIIAEVDPGELQIIHDELLSAAEQQGVAEGTRAPNEIGGADSMRQKLGNIIKQAAQDDEIAYNKPGLYRKLWITYGGDIDAIIAERSIFELQQLARELVTANKQDMAETRRGQIPMTLNPGETDNLEPENLAGFRALPAYKQGQAAQQKAGKQLIQKSPYTFQSDQDWAYRQGATDAQRAAMFANFGKSKPLTTEGGEQQKGADYRDPKEVDYDDEYDAMVARVKRLAGLGPMKTVYDPNKRQYRNMPTAVQPKK
jgi:hypothetical protein